MKHNQNNSAVKKLCIWSLLLWCGLYFAEAQDTNKVDNQGRKQGFWTKKNAQGNTLYTGQFRDDKEYGLFTYYHNNGSIERKAVFSQEGKRAETESYYPSGKVMAKGNYWNRKKDSTWVYYRENGKISFKENYKDGQKNGRWELYDQNGILNEAFTYKDDKKNGEAFKNLYFVQIYYHFSENLRHGSYEEYYSDKTPRIKGNYQQGQEHGTWTTYTTKGNPIKKDIWLNGTLQSETLLLQTAKGVKQIPVEQVAFFTKTGTFATLVTTQGTIYKAENTADDLADCLGSEEFLMVNDKQRSFCRYSCIKGLKGNVVETDPATAVRIYADEEGVKAVHGTFRPDDLQP